LIGDSKRAANGAEGEVGARFVVAHQKLIMSFLEAIASGCFLSESNQEPDDGKSVDHCICVGWLHAGSG